jgi:hypothetical protein
MRLMMGRTLTRWIPVAAALLLQLLIAGTAGADDGGDAQKEKDIKEMLRITGAGETAIQVSRQMIASFKQEMPEVPDKFWKEVENEVDKESLINLAVPVYAKYFTGEEIRELLKFYQSALGKKLLEKQGKILEDVTTAAQKWGEELGQKITDKLEKEGYE